MPPRPFAPPGTRTNFVGDRPVRLDHVRLEWEIDLAARPSLRAAISDQLHHEAVIRVIVDLSDVSFIASMGMRLLLIAGRTVAAKGGKMALLAPIPDVDAVLRTARIDGVMPICTARADALAAVSST